MRYERIATDTVCLREEYHWVQSCTSKSPLPGLKGLEEKVILAARFKQDRAEAADKTRQDKTKVCSTLSASLFLNLRADRTTQHSTLILIYSPAHSITRTHLLTNILHDPTTSLITCPSRSPSTPSCSIRANTQTHQPTLSIHQSAVQHISIQWLEAHAQSTSFSPRLIPIGAVVVWG